MSLELTIQSVALESDGQDIWARVTIVIPKGYNLKSEKNRKRLIRDIESAANLLFCTGEKDESDEERPEA